MNADRALLLLCLALAPVGEAWGAITCVGNSASMSLGVYVGDTSSPTDSIGSFGLTCTREGGPAGVTITMSIGPSANTGSIANRRLRQAAGTDLLSYNLYHDASRLTVWGDVVGMNTVSRTLNLPNKTPTGVTFNIYGRIAGSQDVYAGPYSDALVVTIDY